MHPIEPHPQGLYSLNERSIQHGAVTEDYPRNLPSMRTPRKGTC